MPDSATVAKLRAAWPNVPIISFTSSLEALSVSCDQSSKPSEPKDEKTYRDSLSAQDTGKCRNCGKIAPLLCNGCKGLPAARGNSTIAARYCTKECQKQDWTVHKNDCKAAKTRQLLYRVADLTKGLFYIHSEITFSWAYLKKIDCYGPLRAVYTDEVKSERRNTLLVPFSTVTDLVSDRKEQEAYLSHLGCSGAVARFGPLLAARLRGNLQLIEEIIVTPKNHNLSIVKGQKEVDNRPVFRKDGLYHTILRVTLASQEQYAVDLTGAQYGHAEECLPWEDYVTARVDQIIEVQPVGTSKKWLAEQIDPVRLMQWSMKLNFLNEMEICIGFWEVHGGSIDALLALPEKQWLAKKESLLEYVKTFMKHLKEDSIRQGSWCRE